MIPTRTKQRSPLFQQATSRSALLRAWLDVRPRASNSKDQTTRAAAEAFGRAVDKSIRELQRDLRRGDFKFAAQRGVLKRRKTEIGGQPRNPRPIVIAPVLNRIVQRAILDTCQTDEARFLRRLGSLPAFLATPTSVGGLPGRGVAEAIDLITAAIGDGARWYVRSDIQNFFQAIPKPTIETILRANIADTQFVELFMRALATELSNEAEVRDMISLFPIGDIGIPQGSALSAFCANLVLADFDTELNRRGIRTIRYLDDFVILGPSGRAVTRAWERAKAILGSMDMKCHDPSTASAKAGIGEITNGFDFLSFHITDRHTYPSDAARTKFLAEIRETVADAKREIAAAGNEPRRAEPRYIQSLALLDRKIRGWGDAFSSATLRVVLAQLDDQIEVMVGQYMSWFGRFVRGRGKQHRRRLTGIALLADSKRREATRS